MHAQKDLAHMSSLEGATGTLPPTHMEANKAHVERKVVFAGPFGGSHASLEEACNLHPEPYTCSYMGGCQNYGSFWIPIIIRHLVLLRGTQKGPSF